MIWLREKPRQSHGDLKSSRALLMNVFLDCSAVTSGVRHGASFFVQAAEVCLDGITLSRKRLS